MRRKFGVKNYYEDAFSKHSINFCLIERASANWRSGWQYFSTPFILRNIHLDDEVRLIFYWYAKCIGLASNRNNQNIIIQLKSGFDSLDQLLLSILGDIFPNTLTFNRLFYWIHNFCRSLNVIDTLIYFEGGFLERKANR